MRCPKCGFNSFDHNLTCPKCRKDLSVIRRQLGLTVPIPGHVDFFQTASQRGVYPEPVLSAEEMEEPGLADPFSAPPFAGVPPYTAAGDVFGGASAMSGFGGPGQAPFGEAAPMAGPLIDDILPAEDDSIDDIAPIDAYEELSPIMEGAPQGYPAPAESFAAAPQGFPAPAQAPPFPAYAPPQAPQQSFSMEPPQVYPEAAPNFQAPPPQAFAEPPHFSAPAAVPIPQAVGAAALAPDLETEEIEIELDAFDNSVPSAAPFPEAVQTQAAAAMDQIKTTLAETGDLAVQAIEESAGPLEGFVVNDFSEMELEEPDYAPEPVEITALPHPVEAVQPQLAPSPVMTPDATLGVAQPQAAPVVPSTDTEDLSSLVGELDLDKLDSEL